MYVCVCVGGWVGGWVGVSTTPARLLLHPTTPLSLSFKDGDTPLYAAAYNGNTGAVKELVAAGCDINLADKVQQMTRLALALACLGFRTRVA